MTIKKITTRWSFNCWNLAHSRSGLRHCVNHTCKMRNAFNVGKTVHEKLVPFARACLRSLFSSTAMSMLSFFCKNRGKKRISPKTLVPNGIRRHERVIAETRNLLPYDGRTSPTYPCAHGREGLKATGNQFREFWFDIARKSLLTLSGLTFVLISTAVSVLSFFCKNRWNKRNTPKTLVQNGTHHRENVSYNGAEVDTHDKPNREIISRSEFVQIRRL